MAGVPASDITAIDSPPSRRSAKVAATFGTASADDFDVACVDQLLHRGMIRILGHDLSHAVGAEEESLASGKGHLHGAPSVVLDLHCASSLTRQRPSGMARLEPSHDRDRN